MNFFRPVTSATLFTVLLLTQTPVFAVDDYYQQQLQNEKMLKRQVALQKKMEHDRYIRQVEDKALRGATNIVSAPLEIPKDMINIYNEPEIYPEGNLLYAIVGGALRGTLDASGRVITGAMDLITAPIPTKVIMQPVRVWDDFDKTDTYGQIYRLVDNPKIEPYVAPEPRPVVVQNTPIEDHTEQYRQEINQNLDTMFRKEMMK